ncbi:hypothetical protein G3446_26660 [Thiorhodococcus minor]|uniref:Uncharacterized protein n=2 Tax=Thiorhodococcus minor TaxID=57489 RepID=A0A6M0K6K4_9GAMM|nr:hypothetical protein [Thiorhodococcus minor]
MAEPFGEHVGEPPSTAEVTHDLSTVQPLLPLSSQPPQPTIGMPMPASDPALRTLHDCDMQAVSEGRSTCP